MYFDHRHLINVSQNRGHGIQPLSSGQDRRSCGGSPKQRMAAALAPVTSLGFKPQSAVRLLSAYARANPRNFSSISRTIALHVPQLSRPLTPPSIFYGVDPSVARRRCLCTVISAALSSSEAIGKPKPEFYSAETGEKVGEFRKRLRIVDIKGGPDEGLDRLGQTLTVKGWVRTLRVQSSVVFIEVNDGSCLSNMQCVMNSDADGYYEVPFKKNAYFLWGVGS